MCRSTVSTRIIPVFGLIMLATALVGSAAAEPAAATDRDQSTGGDAGAGGDRPGRPAGAGDTEGRYEIVRRLPYVRRGNRDLLADVYRPLVQGPHPAVLCLHGGAWIAGNRSQPATIARFLAARGYVAVSIDYRLAPWSLFPAQIEDCRQALRWMVRKSSDLEIDAQRLGVWGYSAGGHLAALLGCSRDETQADRRDGPAPRVRAVVAGGAPCDFRSIPEDSPALMFWLGSTRAEAPERYRLASPAAFVSQLDPPCFFYHGQRDRAVKIAQPRAMAESLKRAGVHVTMHVVPEANHLQAHLNREALARAVDFLDDYVRSARSD
jgi:triacylglycerol lipase